MTGPDITILWNKQVLTDHSEFLLEQQCFGDCDSCIPESEQENSFSAIPILMSEYVLQINIVQDYISRF